MRMEIDKYGYTQKEKEMYFYRMEFGVTAGKEILIR
jgi:hypothetical protein